MNAERLHALGIAIRDDLSHTAIVDTLESLRAALEQQVQNPGSAAFQEQVSNLRTQIVDALRKAPSNSFPPSWRQLLVDLEITHLLGEELAETIEDSFTRNQITPASAQQDVTKSLEKVRALQSTVNQLLAALSWLEIGSEELETGHFEIGILIPRSAVRNELSELGNEFIHLEQLLQPFQELATGSRPPLTLRSIASTDFSAFLDAHGPLAAALAIALERVIAGYKTLLEIRKLRADLAEKGIQAERLAGVDAFANEHMATAVDDAVTELVTRFEVNDAGRVNELKIELRMSMNALANRIDRGYNIEVRTGPVETEAPDGDDTQEPPSASAVQAVVYAEMVRSRQEKMQFINASGAPILSLPEAPSEEPES